MLGSDAILRALEAEGVDVCFGIPGGAILPLYDAGNFGMQRRRVHGVMADPSFDPRALADNRAVEFTKEMEGIDTVPGPRR